MTAPFFGILHKGDDMRTKENIDFTKIDWNDIDIEKLHFFFKEAVDYNDILLHDINNLNNKAFQLLAILFPVLSADVGFLLAIWGKDGKEPVTAAILAASAGLALVIASLILAVFPRKINRGKLTPNIAFKGNLYKASMEHLLADCIASYYSYINSNNKILKYRGFFLTIGTAGIFVVPLFTIAVFLLTLLS
jgi:hypothetical protein